MGLADSFETLLSFCLRFYNFFGLGVEGFVFPGALEATSNCFNGSSSSGGFFFGCCPGSCLGARVGAGGFGGLALFQGFDDG